MRTLILMRHAKSDWANEGLDDKDRPLNDRGKKAAPKMARWLAKQGCTPDRVLSSTAVRTCETWNRMKHEFNASVRKQSVVGGKGESLHDIAVDWSDSLYLAEPKVIWDSVCEVFEQYPTAETLLVLGHNPGMEILISGLSGHDLAIPTAAAAIFQIESSTPLHGLVESMENKHWKFVELQYPKGLAD